MFPECIRPEPFNPRSSEPISTSLRFAKPDPRRSADTSAPKSSLVPRSDPTEPSNPNTVHLMPAPPSWGSLSGCSRLLGGHGLSSPRALRAKVNSIGSNPHSSELTLNWLRFAKQDSRRSADTSAPKSSVISKSAPTEPSYPRSSEFTPYWLRFVKPDPRRSADTGTPRSSLVPQSGPHLNGFVFSHSCSFVFIRGAFSFPRHQVLTFLQVRFAGALRCEPDLPRSIC
jgi:hypothetical protein